MFLYSNHNWILYIAAFFSAFGITLASTPLAKKISFKVGGVAYPNVRSMHKEPMPSLGGIAIVLGFLVSVLLLTPFIPELRTKEFAGFIAGAVIIALVGAVDDIYELRPLPKFIFQVIAALVVVCTGTTINFMKWPFLANFPFLGPPVTILWIVGITNAVNFIDGLDGLAAGVSSICGLCLTVLCVLSGNQLAVMLSAAIAGSCFGFLPRNFSPAEVIMGDMGALFLGYVLSVSSIFGLFKGYALLAVAIAGFVLALPIFDMLFVTVRRILSGKAFSAADKGHLHHRLIAMGYSQTRSVLILYLFSALCGAISIVIAFTNLDWRALGVIVAFLVMFLMMLYVYKKRMGK
ncbi:MAG: undecaprenyl/decaprenyl-phosphate alpha-N-acetylglucosaminyl 1-phosphate transferase [Clostridiales bacterium]|jgi:UDP-GlcNAc:undecaprenyl-phosphate GlcNAc-1-phosphate transferase|nr:undecaprenyl/decaprenyl-phosphate alpha-N-acetylglucosaminyl 1-phosphate transferase [Clostridiales bacterium]